MRNKRRKLIIITLIVLCFLIQSTVMHFITMGSVGPNLLIIITASFGFMRGKKEGMFTGFLCGLLIDIYFSDMIGFQAMLYMLIGYGNGCFHRIFYDDDIKLPLALVGASEFIYSFMIFIVSFVLRSKFNMSYYFIQVMIPGLVYTLLVTLVVYQLMRKINLWLEKLEKRSESKFV